jgi:hypothetical protein
MMFYSTWWWCCNSYVDDALLSDVDDILPSDIDDDSNGDRREDVEESSVCPPLQFSVVMWPQQIYSSKWSFYIII